MNDLIAAHLQHCRAAGLAEKTIDDRRKILLRLDQELPYGVELAATEELEAWFGAGRGPSGRGWSIQTRATYYTHVTAFYRWATTGSRPHLDWDPSADLRRPRVPAGVPRPATDAQVADVIARVSRPWRTAFILAAFAGMRVSEIAAATREQLDVDTLRITGKGGKTRVVPRHPMIAAEVAHLQPGPLFRTVTGLPADGDWISREGSAVLTGLGYPTLTMHQFRHWFGTSTLAGTGNLRVVQELMGHASPTTTAIYTLITGEQRRDAITALPTLAAASC